jgi:hypothetical protein
MDSIKYCNEVMARLETLMYQELSGMAHWKCEYVGTDFIRSKTIQGKNIPEIVESCVKEIKAAGIVSDITYKTSPDGIMLKLKVKNCIHHAKEVLVEEEGVAPYICPIGNMILDQIHEKLKFTTSYKAKQAIDKKNQQCLIYMALYKTPDQIGQVSDWLKDDEDREWLENQPSQILAAADRKKQE